MPLKTSAPAYEKHVADLYAKLPGAGKPVAIEAGGRSAGPTNVEKETADRGA
jgi:hypothetical protein